MFSPNLIRTQHRRHRHWILLTYERIMAIAVTVNVGLVLFDLSYIPWRDFWLQGKIQVPIPLIQPVLTVPILSNETDSSPITQLYDPVKGIEPNRDTQQYLDLVDQLEQIVDESGTSGLRTPTARQILIQLQTLSTEMIDTNPFQLAEKSGTLERIKNKMRDLIPNPDDSAKESFDTFWSPNYLIQATPQGNGLQFFQEEIRPLFEVNYFRPLGEDGQFINYFPLIDLVGFSWVFGFEFLIRTWFIGRQHTGVSWRDAMLWRWYDLLLLIPFARWLRVIPAVIRLSDAQLVNFTRIRNQLSQGFVTLFAEDLTEVVVIRVINQMQLSIRRGEMIAMLTQPNSDRIYIDINNVNELEAITQLLVQMIVYKVLPKVQPEIAGLLKHNIEAILQQNPAYQNLQRFPGLAGASTQLSEQMANQITVTAYQAIAGSLEDKVGTELLTRLSQRFSETLMGALQEEDPLRRLEGLIADFLEEVKINYVQRLSQEDLEEIMEETRRLRQKQPRS